MAYTDPSSLTFAFEEIPTAAKVNSATNDQFLALFPDGATNTDWDPTWLTTGSGFAVKNADGAQYRVGALFHGWARCEISTVGTGNYYIELPYPAVGIPAGTVIGSCWAEDSSASPNNKPGVVLLASGSPQQFRFMFPGGWLGATFPFTMATDDPLSFTVCYPIA